jgi:sec-independent protein translocase protein TatC
MKHDDYADPDDMFADTRMTFGEHIEDLRTHLMRAIKGFVIGMVVCLLVSSWILEFITAPVDRELNAFYERHYDKKIKQVEEDMLAGRANIPTIRIRVKQRPVNWVAAPKADPDAVMPKLVPHLMAWLKEMGIDGFVDPVVVDPEGWVEVDQIYPDPAAFARLQQQVKQLYDRQTLKTLSIQEGFVVYFKIAIMAGFVVSSPWVFLQVWLFVAAGLYPHEKRLVNVYLPVSLVLFLAGAAICQFFVIPKAVEALLWFNELIGVMPDLRLNEWLGFAIFMPVVFGISFQTPLVMLFLFMIGLFDIAAYKEKRRMAYFAMAVFAAVITPSTDAFSMMFMWVPMCLLYEFGIFMCWYKGREEEETPPDESYGLVEV